MAEGSLVAETHPRGVWAGWLGGTPPANSDLSNPCVALSLRRRGTDAVALPCLQEREQAVDAIITAYTARLRERTRHHLGCVQPVAAGI